MKPNTDAPAKPDAKDDLKHNIKLCDRTHHGSESRLAPMLIVNAKIVMLKKNTMTQ
jgi:hypothetical protein